MTRNRHNLSFNDKVWKKLEKEKKKKDKSISRILEDLAKERLMKHGG